MTRTASWWRYGKEALGVDDALELTDMVGGQLLRPMQRILSWDRTVKSKHQVYEPAFADEVASILCAPVLAHEVTFLKRGESPAEREPILISGG